MNVEVMDQQNVHTSARLFHQMNLPSEKQVGKTNTIPDHRGINGMVRTPSRMSIVSSPLEELLPNVALPKCLKLYPSHVAGTQRGMFQFDGETTANFSDPSWRYLNDHSKSWSNGYLHPASNALNVQMARVNVIHDSGPSSTLSSETFARKLKLSADDVLPHHYANAAASCQKFKEPSVSTKDTHTDSIENLLPNEEDLFSGLTTELGSTVNGSNGDEEFDIFSSGGGLELDGDCRLHVERATANYTEGIFNDQRNANGSVNPGSLTIGSFPHNGHQHVWSNVHSFQQHLPNPRVWSTSLPFVNDICANSTPQVPVLVEAPPHVMYTFSPTHIHHIGSAPSGSQFGRNLQHGYIGESPKSLDLHLNSLCVGGFPSSPLLHPSQVASHNIFPQVSGNCIDMSTNSAVCSPQNTHIFPVRDVATSMPTSFSSTKERHKKGSHRRQEANSGPSEQKKYELDIDRVLHGLDNRTTLMIKNIPNKYTSKTLLAAIDEHNRGAYDFIYLPIDFKNKCNMGYAFINMVDPLQIIPFYKTFNGKKWEKYHSGKVASLAYARIQGKAALIAHFQDSSLMNEDKSCHPILFSTDGPNAGGQEAFPIGTGIRPRQHKMRYNSSEESQVQENQSSSLKVVDEFKQKLLI